MRKSIFVFLFVLLFATTLTTSAQAATFSGAENYTLLSNEVVNNNLYAGGGNASVYGIVGGDLFVGGGTVTTLGKVEKDLFAGGGNLNISGEVGEDARVAGGSVVIGAKINGETLAAGGQVTVLSGAVLAQDVYLAGGTVVMSGTITGNLTIYAETAEVNGPISGNVTIQATKLIFGSGANIGGSLNYKTPEQINIPATLTAGEVTYEKYEGAKNRKRSAGGFAVFAMFKLLSMLAVVAVLYAIFKKGGRDLVTNSLDEFWKKVLVGFIVLVVTPVAGIIIAITILGLPVTFMLALSYGLLLIIASLGAGPVFGTWLYSLIKKNKETEHKYAVKWKTVLGGVFVLGLITMMPVIGWFVTLIFFLAVLGQLCFGVINLLKQAR